MRKLPRIIRREEYEQLDAAARRLEGKAKSSSRKRTIREYRIAMMLGFNAGLRISEIVGYKDKVPKLAKEQIEVSHIRVISGKGQKDRIVPRPKPLNETIRSMFPLSINRRPLQNFVTKLGQKVLNKEISFHTLRHGFATELLEKGFDISQVQMFMGHSRLDTTGIYLHANPTKALKKYEETF